MKLELANQVRKIRATKNKWFLYGIIDKNPGITIYDLSKKINWSTGKISYYVKQLLKDGIINNSSEIINGRAKISYSPKEVRELINWDEMTFIKKPET